MTATAPNHFTEREEEWMIRDYFQDRRGGVFVDVGANHYQSASKTYYLETRLGWSGMRSSRRKNFRRTTRRTGRAPNSSRSSCRTSRTTWPACSSSRVSTVASSDQEFVKQFGTPDEVRDVPTITLTDLLDAEGIRRIDFLSMDIELHEPQALKGFDIRPLQAVARRDRRTAAGATGDPGLLRPERIRPRRQVIWVDRENLYFAPLPEGRSTEDGTR